MKTKRRAIAALTTTLFMAMPFFGVMADTTAKPHKVVLKNLTVDSVDTSTKTIAAHSDSTSYIIDISKAKIRRASGEKAPLSEFEQDDSITVWGTTTNGTNIKASKVRNNSIRKIKGLYLATIIFIAPADDQFPEGVQGAFAMVKKNNQFSVIFTYGYTKFYYKSKKSTYADLKEGDVVAIKGILRSINQFGMTELLYNTTQVKVRKHGTVPSYVLPTSFKFNH